jgi:hypothetical protein
MINLITQPLNEKNGENDILMPQGSPPKKPWGSTDGSCDLLLTKLSNDHTQQHNVKIKGRRHTLIGLL